MNVSTYKVRLDPDNARHPFLVKEGTARYGGTSLCNPAEVADMLNSCFSLSEMAEEYLYLVVADTKMHPLGVFELSHGTVNSSLASPREIILRVLLCGGICFAMVHNHPSGDTSPSKEDVSSARCIKEAAKMMDLCMVDSIIVGGNGTYLSLDGEDLI